MTDLRVEPGGPLRGTLRVPGCKGISHRALLLAAIADGTSEIRGLADGADVRSTRRALEHLDLSVSEVPGGVRVVGRGFDMLSEPDDPIDCGNSGTTMRMLAGMLAGPTRWRTFASAATSTPMPCHNSSRPVGERCRPARRKERPSSSPGQRAEKKVGSKSNRVLVYSPAGPRAARIDWIQPTR